MTETYRHLPRFGRPPAVAQIILAAGASRRMGGPKALRRLGGEPFLARILAAGKSAGLAPLVVVLGSDRAIIENDPVVAPWLDGCLVVENLDPASGPLASLRLALAAIATAGSAIDGAIVTPVDQPLQTAELLRALVAELARTGAPIVVPVHGGRRGHPTLFAARLFPELERAPLDEGARAVVRAHAAAIAELAADERVLCDLDTPEDLAEAEDLERARAVSVTRYEAASSLPGDDLVVVEEPLEIRLRGRSLALLMRTPGHDEELARGFLLTEDVVRTPEQILGLRRVAPNVIDVDVAPAIAAGRTDVRHFFATSSCGVCGKASLQALAIRFPPVVAPLRLDRDRLYELPARLASAQAIFARTGGLHAAGLFSPQGELVLCREDIGRHNAVDKLIGARSLVPGGLPLAEQLLLVSGRTSFEILQKAAAAGLPIVAAVSAPSSLAIRLAEDLGITLVGFLRGRSCNVYTHPERITG